MNKARLKTISELVDELRERLDALEEIKSDEEDYFDNMPENLQGSERGEISEEAVDAMDRAIDSLNETVDALDEILER